MKTSFNFYNYFLLETKYHHWPAYYLHLAQKAFFSILNPKNSSYTEEKAKQDALKLKDKFENLFINHNKNSNRNRKLFQPLARIIAELRVNGKSEKEIYKKDGILDYIISKLLLITNNSRFYTDQFIQNFRIWSFDEFKKYAEKLELNVSNVSEPRKSLNANPNNYDVIFIDDFYQFNKLFGRHETGGGNPQMIWCTARFSGLYHSYLKDLRNLQFVVLAKKDWKKIKPEDSLHGEKPEDHNPYDEYGLSLVNFIINWDDPNLKFTDSCLRWNHLGDFDYAKTGVKNYGGDHAFLTWDDVSKVYGFDVQKLIKSKADPSKLKNIQIKINNTKNANSSVAQKLKKFNEEAQKTNSIITLKYKQSSDFYDDDEEENLSKNFLSDFERKNVSEISIPKFIDISDCFSYCNKLKKVTFENGIKIIPESAFNYCNSLEEINLPNDLEEIKKSAFNYCKSLTKIDLPESLKRIGDSAFSKSGLANISIPNNISIIEDDCFNDCGSLFYIKLPDNLKIIKERAFYGCSSLEQIKFPNTLTEIQNMAFNFCLSLKNVEIPKKVKKIGSQAFFGGFFLEKITFLGTPQELGENCFFVAAMTAQNLDNSKTKYVKEIIGPQETLNNFKFTEPEEDYFEDEEKQYLYYKNSLMGRVFKKYPIKLTVLK